MVRALLYTNVLIDYLNAVPETARRYHLGDGSSAWPAAGHA